jgi:thiamine pyrophosphokinase
MKTCVIFCAGEFDKLVKPLRGDEFVIAADGGYAHTQRLGLKPDIVLGDFDSLGFVPEGAQRYPVEKDDTDIMLCMKKGLSRGFDDFLVVGGFGGRIDHTMGNLQALRYVAHRAADIVMSDGESWATVVEGGAVRVPAKAISGGPVKLSVFALDRECRGVSIRGTKWEIENGTWTNGFPLGVSNEFTAEYAEISVTEGALLVTVCREEHPGRGE